MACFGASEYGETLPARYPKCQVWPFSSTISMKSSGIGNRASSGARSAQRGKTGGEEKHSEVGFVLREEV
jgi:hypothetical protein